MKLEFENIKETETVFIIKDKENNTSIGLTIRECYELQKQLKRIVPEIKGPENVTVKSF